MDLKKTLDIVISFLIAIVLWFYLINIVNPQKDAQIKYVPVNVTGVEALEERGLAVAGGLDFQVNLKIVAARNDLQNLTAADFTATVDVASLTKEDTFITVKVAAPRGVTIEDIESENIDVVVEDFITESKDVRVNFLDEEDKQEITIHSMSYDKVYVSGALSDVNNVAFVAYNLSAKSLNVDNLSTIALTGTPVDKSGAVVGGVEIDNEALSIDATIYNVKTVQLATQIEGLPEGGELSIENYEIDPVITIKGPLSAIDKLTSISADPISIEGLSDTKTFTLKPNLPEGVLKSRTTKDLKATVYIKVYQPEELEDVTSEGAIEEGPSAEVVNN